ncbi:MAG: CoA-transferase [Acidimicrobiales bacterium]
MDIDKVVELESAINRFVQPGATIHLAYGGGRPNAAVAAIIRRFAGTRPGFTISACGFVSTQHALVAAGLVSKLIVAFAGDNFPAPRPSRILQRSLREERLTIENWSIWSLTARLVAGALGTPFFPVQSLTATDMGEELSPEHYTTVAGADGETCGVVSALHPDVVLLPGVVADRMGNVLLAPPYGEGAWGALAGKATIACVERLVDTEVIRANSSLPSVPSYAVDAVCITPFGSHPYGFDPGVLAGVVDGYGEDEEFMAAFAKCAKTEQGAADWVQQWIRGPRTHAEFLDQLGTSRLEALQKATQAKFEHLDDDVVISPTERMTLTTVRVLRDRVRARQAALVLSGIGYAHLAAWTAAPELAEEGQDVNLAAELGMVGFHPRPGDPYLFARQNFASCLQLADVMSVLGRDIGGPRATSIGVLGAGQIDMSGNINSTWSGNGDFIVGSGGASDVAHGADEIIVVLPHDRDRLVERVPYVTAPGSAVSTIVTTEAVLERRSDGFVATTFLGGGDPTEAERRLVALTGWPLSIAHDLHPEPEPSRSDVERLRSFDPRGIFFGRD